MKIHKVSQWLSLIFFVTVFVSCTQSTESTIPSPATAPVLLVSATLTETMPPALTSTATDIPTPAFTPTSVPTLPAEAARKKMLELLANNGDCRLPCLWGITPGKSTNQEARAILIPLSSISTPETTYFDPSRLRGILGATISPLIVEGELHLNSRVDYLYEDNGIVSSVGFEAIEEKVEKDPSDPSGNSWLSKTPIYGLPTFIKRTEYYSLSHLLSEQGIPTSVMVASSGPSIKRSGSIFTHIAVLYPNQGIWAQYTTLVNEDEVGSSIKSCPINAHIEMNLYPSGNPDSFYALLDKTGWGRMKGGYKPLEEATSMSVEKFYETFRNPTDKCIETPTSLWPTPER